MQRKKRDLNQKYIRQSRVNLIIPFRRRFSNWQSSTVFSENRAQFTINTKHKYRLEVLAFACKSYPFEWDRRTIRCGFRQIERFRFCGHIHPRRFPFIASQDAIDSNERNRDWLQSVPRFLLAGWGYIVSSDCKYQSHLTALIALHSERKTCSVISSCFENVFSLLLEGKREV